MLAPTRVRRRLPRGLVGAARRLSMDVFDTSLKTHHRNSAALSPDYAQYTYLRDEVAWRLVDSLDDVHERYTFPRAYDVGCGNGHIRRALAGAGSGGVTSLIECDTSEAMLALSADAVAADPPADFTVSQLQMTGEIPRLEPGSADLVMSSMAMHWVNDLPRFLSAARRALRPDGARAPSPPPRAPRADDRARRACRPLPRRVPRRRDARRAPLIIRPC